MNRGPTVAQSLPVDRYAGNCLIKPSYYCGGAVHNALPSQEQPPRNRYDAGAGGYHHHGGPTPYQHYQHLQDWYGRTAYWHHHHRLDGGGGGPLQAEKANFAAHKHGAPLIQAAKYCSNRAGGGGPGKNKYAKKLLSAEQPNNTGKKSNDGGSDESSGAASENSLPRIIKPRKRRKKERKPMPVVAAVVTVTAVQPLADRPLSSPSPSPPPSPIEQLTSSKPQPLLDAQLFDTVQLSADIKAVSLEDVSTCQCACCDPVGNVWDVGRRCFSPSLTRPEPSRRSWSGESSSSSASSLFSKVAVVDYTKPENVTPVVRVRTHSLEVSSEIVTSHNGHRDIEIKFFTMPIRGDH